VQRAGIVRAQLTLDESHVAPGERRAPGWSVDDILQDYAPVVNGLPFDARELPVEIQVEAYLKGIIPYVPGLGRDGTAATIAAQRS